MGNEKQVRVAIIGAGVSGVMLAINLQQRLGLESVTVSEIRLFPFIPGRG